MQPLSAPQHYVPPSARELRAQAVQRLQAGLFGLAAVILMVGLASIINDRARQAEAAIAPQTAPSASPSLNSGSDPLAEVGVVPSTAPITGSPTPGRPWHRPRRRRLVPSRLGRAMGPSPNRKIAAALLLAMGIAAAAAAAVLLWKPAPAAKAPAGPIGVFSSIPLMFAETGEMTLDAAPPWPRAVIAAQGEPRPLDSLVGDGTSDPLAGITRLIIAQPRALNPQENVALDAWVRGGGKLLLLIDPMYTGHTAYALGDPRRPQSLAMLGPILTHWGLLLDFDEITSPKRILAKVMGLPVPMELPGTFFVIKGDRCRTWDSGLAVTCALGQGRVYAIADASVIDPEADDPIHRDALKGLLDAAFGID